MCHSQRLASHVMRRRYCRRRHPAARLQVSNLCSRTNISARFANLNTAKTIVSLFVRTTYHSVDTDIDQCHSHAVVAASRLPPAAEQSPARRRGSLEPGQLPPSPAAGTPAAGLAASSAGTPAAPAVVVKAEPPLDAAMLGIALPPGFAASPDRQSSDAEAAAEAQGAEAQLDGSSAPKRRRLGWGQGLARRSAGPDTAQRRQRPVAAEVGASANGAVDIAVDTAAGDAEPPSQQPQPDPSTAVGAAAAPPMQNGHAQPAQPSAAAAPEQPQPPQPPLPSKLELMSTMEKV
jgi:hypothetical protein